VMEGFIDTQRKALETAEKLFEKHKPALEEAEKAEREKQQAQAKIEAAKRKEEQKKAKVKEDLQKATSDEGSLFCSCADEADEEAETQELDEDTEADDGYGFEEDDED
jgi:ribosomal protein L9